MIKAFDRVKQTMAKHPYLSTALFVLVVNLVNQFVKSSHFPSYRQYSNQPYPTRFFSLQSPVVDYPYGNIADVGSLLMDEEALFVLYYAPWCAQSMEMKHEFEKAAKFLENEILFVAINCWHRLSDCRQRNSFMMFPVFYFYVIGQEGFKYNGVMRADYMVDFILHMLHPLTYISSQEKLAEFISERDTNVLGYFNFTSLPPSEAFNEFYSAALLTIERDPKNMIAFGVLTNAHLAMQLNLTDSPSVVLVRSLNDSLKFPSNQNFSTLSAWALGFRQQSVVKWILPSGLKSLSLSSDLRHGPAVILFLPAMPLSPANHYVALLRQIALTYYNCNQSSTVSGMVTTNVYSVAKSFLQRQILEKQCSQISHSHFSFKQTRRDLPLKSCCMTLKNSSCQFCFHYHRSHPSSVRSCPVISSMSVDTFPAPTSGRECSETMRNYNPGEYISCCCDRQPKLPIKSTASAHSGASSAFMHEEGVADDDLFVKGRSQGRLETKCHQLSKLKAFGWDFFSFSDSDVRLLGHHEFPDEFVGLSCKTNRTVKFFAMDTVRGHMFLENLGLDSKLPDNQVAMVLYNFKNEVLHVMKEEFLHPNILKFIENFTTGTLTSFRRTARKSHDVHTCSTKANQICIVEVTSKTFRKIVLDNTKDVVLLYYAPWCGFCAGFNHVYLTLANYFRSVENIVFARINGDSNDIPWQYTVPEYPTLIFYPAHSKSNSVLFPLHQPNTLPNLVKFVLRWSSNSFVLNSGLKVCTHDCISSNKNMSAIRIENLLQEIDITLQDISKALSYRQLLEVQLRDLGNTGSEELSLITNKMKQAELHEASLHEKLYKARLQLDSTQHLYGILKSTSEYYLDRDSFLSIAKQHIVYKSRLKNYEVL